MKLFEKDFFWKNNVLELILFNFWSWERSVQLLDFSFSFSHSGDHSPGLYFDLNILNLQIIHIEWYNTRHKEY